MRLHTLSLLASLSALAIADIAADQTTSSEDAVETDVPLELTQANWNDEVNKTRWLMVKHFSPYCGHCKKFQPTYQTIFQWYNNTQHPDPDKVEVDSDSTKNYTFQEYHNFTFGTIDCIVYGDLCTEHDVQSYPTTILFEYGTVFDKVVGNKNESLVSDLIERALNKGRPGSRPKDLVLPKAGDKFPRPKPQQTAAQSPLGTDTAKGAEATFGKDWKVPTPGQLELDREPEKPLVVPNSEGVSVAHNAETFQKLVTQTQDAWFIKFYAPWCSHCQAMGPAWEQLAKSMRGKLNIGEVNCDRESRLCKDVSATAYPTIVFFKGGERAEHSGLRGLGDFIEFADKAIDLAAGVPEVNATSLKALEEKEDVVFVYFYDHATTSEDFRALERLPLSLIGHAKLVKTSDPKLFDRFKITTWPRLIVSREGRPTYFPPITPDEMRDKNAVLDWMRSVWLPLVPEVTPSNARQIFSGKIVALGVLSHADKDAFTVSLREMKSAAIEWQDRQVQEFQLERKKLRDSKQMRIEEAEDREDQRALRAAKAIRIDMNSSGRKEVGFAWIDGAFWHRWIRQTYGIDVKDGEKIIINDEDNRQYWDQTATGNYIMVSRTSIMETLDKVVYGPHVIRPKLTVSTVEKMLLDMRRTLVEHPWLSLGCILGIAFGTFSWLRGRSRRIRGGHFRLDDGLGRRELKDGLLGMSGHQNTKAD